MSNFPAFFYGQPQVATYTGAILGGYSEPLNSTDVAIKVDGDPVLIQSMEPGSLGQVLDLVYKNKPTTFEMTLNRINQKLMAASLLGTGSSYAQQAAATQTQTVTLILDEWVQLIDADGKPIRNISNVSIATKTLDTDFAVLPKQGQVKALVSGCVGSKSVGFDIKGVTGSTILVATESSKAISVNMLTRNHFDDSEGFLWIPKIIVTPGDAMKLVSSKENEFKFTGNVIKMPGLPLAEFSTELVFAP